MFLLLKYEAINCRFSDPVARQPTLPQQPFAPYFWEVVLMLAPDYEVDVPIHLGVMTHFTCKHYVPV